jgi:hypothetical protein
VSATGKGNNQRTTEMKNKMMIMTRRVTWNLGSEEPERGHGDEAF